MKGAQSAYCFVAELLVLGVITTEVFFVSAERWPAFRVCSSTSSHAFPKYVDWGFFCILS